MQRALNASNNKGPEIKSPNLTNKISAQQRSTALKRGEALKREEKDSSVADPKRSTTVPIKKTLSPAEPQPRPETEGTDKTRSGPSTGQKTPEGNPKTADSKKLPDQVREPEPKKSTATSYTQRDTLHKTALESKTTESVTGKMFGFGTSIFSSASTLISYQDESHTTPPGSRTMSSPAVVSPKLSPVPKITPTVSPSISPTREPKAAQKTGEQKKPAPQQALKTALADDCPLCKTKLNIGSKDPPNHNTCTECKTTVCNQCGFSPMPMGKVC